MSRTDNFFNLIFDDATLTKLLIFEQYIKSWLPVFIKQQEDYIYIFDFFAGVGCDSQNNPGSPIRILSQIKVYQHIIHKTKIKLFFNECKKKYYEKLKFNCDNYLKDNPTLNKTVKINYFNEDFENNFNKLKDNIGERPSLVFMDQFGVKYSKHIIEFEKFQKTDFLIFVSSSFLKRFARTEEFKNSLNLTDEEINRLINTPYKLIHEATLNFLKGRLSDDSPIKLYPFSIKKGKNIYGLIFGSKHILAAEKFLKIVWKISSDNGSANYDIYNDKDKKEPNLFPELVGKTTLESFQEELEEKILNREIETNKDAYYYTLRKGHIPKHAMDVLKKLKKHKKIFYNSSAPLITYDNVVKNRRIIKYEKIKD
ncbi:MAG: three-Cys-motif partner protein TcmP [Atribacterota bacterium]|jgi:three-Cys-motif partner protein|nr:three-Cys-motif partner protein TcmP [Atribacterota bacterium]